MSTYAIGEVRGNLNALLQLLDAIHFNNAQDTLWFTGNLINSSQDSLAVLRFVKDLGSRVVSVLGQEEMRLLAKAEGLHPPDAEGAFDDVLTAHDCDAIVKWLRQCPFLHNELNFTMVHAGIPAEWSLSQAQTLAMEAETSLAMGNHKAFLENIFADDPTRWHAKHRGWKRVRYIVNAFTRMRYCNLTGRLDFNANDSTETETKNLIPWFQLPNRAMANQNIIFGRWPALDSEAVPGIYPLNSGGEHIDSLSVLKISSQPEKISVALD